MSKSLIVISLLLVLTSACNQSYDSVEPSTEQVQFAQPMATLTPTSLLNMVNSVPTQTPSIVTPTAELSCAAPAPHVKAGQQVTVTVEDWDKLKLRSEPALSLDTIVMELNQYTQLRILDGPVCVSSTDSAFLFWKVAVIPSGEIGWVAEGDSLHYFIE